MLEIFLIDLTTWHGSKTRVSGEMMDALQNQAN